MKIIPILMLLIFSMLSIAWINPKAEKIKTGNRLYVEGKYDEAMQQYTDVLIELPESPAVHYNVGASAYKKGDYGGAVKAYTKSQSTDNPAFEEKGHYAIGNCKYKQGELRESSDVTGAIQHYQEALEHYKRAIDLNSMNMDAKFNYEVVQRKIKELQDQQQQNQQHNQDTNQQNEQRQEQPDENSQQDESQEEDSKKVQQQKQEDQRGTTEQKDDEQNASPQGSEEKEEMTKAEALRLLDALKDEEQSQLILRHKRGASLAENFKDW